KEILAPEQVEGISTEQIVDFFNSPIGRRMLQAHKVHREVPFTLGIPAAEIYPDWDGADEKVLIQGIIDCIIEDKDGLFLLDYKTDVIEGRFPGGFSQAEKVMEKRYRTQLEFYEKAINSIWKKQVKAKYLYFFDGN